MPPANPPDDDAREPLSEVAHTWRTEPYVRLAAALMFMVIWVFTWYIMETGAWPLLVGLFVAILIALAVSWWWLQRVSRR